MKSEGSFEVRMSLRNRGKDLPKGKNQPTLDDKLQKKVGFDLEMDKELKDCKSEVERLEKCLKEEKEKRRGLQKKVSKLEKDVEMLMKWKEDCEDMDGNSSYGGSMASGGSAGSGRSGRSWVSEEDVRKVNDMVQKAKELEKVQRMFNIVIRGEHGIKDGGNKEEVMEFVKEKLGIDVKVGESWKNGPVVIAKMENGEEKRKVMVNKSKLKETKIYIDNDLSMEERNKQRDIQSWVKERKEKGQEAKVGFGKVWYRGKWNSWDLILEAEEKEKARKRKREEMEKKLAEANKDKQEESSDEDF